VAMTALTGCLTYERKEQKLTIDRKSRIARMDATIRNVATTETSPAGQWEDFAQLDSLRRSDAYFATAFLPSPEAARVSKRRVWVERGKIHASYTILTHNLGRLAEGWSADSTGYAYGTMLEVTKTNGMTARDGGRTTVTWPRRAHLLLVDERDPHFDEAIPFIAAIRDSAARWNAPAKKPSVSKKKRARGARH
jgi:hypothetical protein